MEDRSDWWGILIVIALVSIAIWFGLTQCSPSSSKVDPTVSAGEPTEVARVSDSSVRREIAVVWAGPEDSMSQLDDGDWHDLDDRDLVTTDESGEAHIEMSDCALVYVFQSSGLQKAACPKSAYESRQLAICATEGFGVLNNACDGEVVIETYTGQGIPNGTYVSVMYIPGTELTLFMVFEGEMQIQPVTDSGTRALGSATQVVAEEFYYTAPDAVLREFAGLPTREAISFDRLPLLLGELGVEVPELASWIERLYDRVNQDGVAPTEPLLEVIMRGGGWALEDELVQEAILSAVYWNVLSENYSTLYEYVPIAVQWASTEAGIEMAVPESNQGVSDAREVATDLEQAKALLEAGGYESFEILLLVPFWDEALLILADEISYGLESIGLEVEVIDAWGVEARDIMSREMQQREVLWLSRW